MSLLANSLCAGHGGPNAADYVRSNLFINLLSHTKFNTDIASALGEGDSGVVARVPGREEFSQARAS